MVLPIHPKARTCLKSLKLPGPIQKQFSGMTCAIDLSNSTNPHVGPLANYPDLNQTELKKIYLNQIQSLDGEERDSYLTPAQVLFTVGSVDGMEVVLRGFAEPNQDTVCLAVPTFPAYEHACIIHNLAVEKVPFLGENYNSVNIDSIKKINPKIVFLCDPNNPTGTKLDQTVIQDLCASIDGFVVVDEAYIEFSRFPSCLKLLSKCRNLIILRTLSKAWGMAATRCGAILADQSIIDTLRYVQVPFGLPTSSQEIIKQQLLNPKAIIHSWDKITADRDDLVNQLSQLKNVTKIFKSESNFIFVTLKNFDASLSSLKSNGIYVVDCSHVLPNSIKVSISLREENNRLLDVLKAL